MKKLNFVEETFRDGQQSLWATRMRTESMLGAAPMIDRAGFESVNIMSGAAFEACIMHLYEDPWERMRLLRKAMPNTNLGFLIRGRNVVGWRRYPNDVIEVMLQCLKKNDIQWIAVFDALNDLRNIEWYIHVAKQVGMKVSGAMVYAQSPVHTEEYYITKAKEYIRLGADSVALADASGVLTPERTGNLVRALRQAVGDVELQLVSHCSTGLGIDNYIEGIKNGVDTVSTVSLPLAYGISDPATIDILSIAREMGVETSLDERLVREIDDYFYWVAYKEDKPIGRHVRFNPAEYRKYAAHQIPGGMMSNLVTQLAEVGLQNRLDEVLEEAARVRREIGYPVMVTPFSQWVGVQATMNVIEGERYRTVPQELRLYARGFYGQPAAPIDPNVLDVLLGGENLIDPYEGFTDQVVDRFRAENGPFASDEELLLALFNTRVTIEKYYKNKKPIQYPDATKPLVALLKELSGQRDIKSVYIEKGPLKLQQVF